MPDAEARLFELLDAERRFNQLAYMFPDTGPYRRELYQKHMMFITAGATKRERAFIGGNSCIGPFTEIETDHGPRPIAELIGASSFAVHSWDGDHECTARAGGVFLKELAPAFRVYLDNGRFFDCNRKHRILTASGWTSFGELIHDASGLRCWQMPRGSWANCGAGDRLYGGQLPPAAGSGQERLPSPACAQALALSGVAHGDVAERKSRRNHVCQRIYPFREKLQGETQAADLCARFQDPTCALDAQWSLETRSALRHIAIASGRHSTLPVEGCDQYRCDAIHGVSSGGSRDVQDSSGPHASAFRSARLWLSMVRPGQWPVELIDGDLGEWIFCPSWHRDLVGGNKIVAVVPTGIQPILDLTVEKTHTYFAGGMVHHNTGKTVLGSFEVACHATGRYPNWWTGHRFDSAIPIWVAGDTSETARDIVQAKLFGNVAKDPDLLGTGMIPRDAIDAESIRYRPNTNRAIDFARVRSRHGGWSIVSIKSYDQGRRSFQGTEIPLIWLDEEEKEGAGVYGECVVRGRGTAGKIILTFTPLRGWTSVVDSFMKWEQANAEGGSKIMITCGWNDVPHLTEEYKRTTLASTAGYLRDARQYGTPVAGKGKVYPVDEKDFVVPPIRLPDHFRRICGFDSGWYHTAAAWLAYDKDSDTAYLYSEYKRGEVEIPVHAAAIKARGLWIPVVGDAAAINQGDGEKILDLYRKQGVRMRLAEKSVDAGIQEVLTRLSTGRLKVFSTCQKWLEEFRRYSYNEQGRIRKQDDHCLHPDTMVITRAGSQRIADLVGTVGEVLTVGGVWAPYRHCRRTAQNQPVVRLTFEDGSEVTCTPDHRFLTMDRGWVEARALQGADCLRESSPKRRRSLRERVTTESNDSADGAAVRCTSVRPAGTSDVYCMTVPATACFAVESGQIVHNCMDATRYAIAGLKYATTQRTAPVERHEELVFGLYR